MSALFPLLLDKAKGWRQGDFPHDKFPAIGEILAWATEPEGAGFRMRAPQVRALEVYWFLRLVESTPKIFALYEKYFPAADDPDALLKALGIPSAAFSASKYQWPALWKNIAGNDDFVREHSLEALRETMALEYPSYILALAMGAGKTALIGAIIATEFAMALEYPDGPFVQNALVFAPGTTILGSLRELAAIPYDRILPPRLFKQFAATVKLIFTRDGERDISVIKGSSFNVVVTNTEKIRIQKETIRKSDIGNLFNARKADEARTELANLRLESIATLPHLGVFSDEAHHTYGQALDTELKKVRKTVDYLHHNSAITGQGLICVVNTTGTPYFKKQPLRDVVNWYGLSQGIADNILKSVAGNIHAYDFDGDARQVVAQVVADFFGKYRDVKLPDGSPAKLAIYFPQTDDLRDLRPVVETKLIELGLPTDLVLERHSDSGVAEKDPQRAATRMMADFARRVSTCAMRATVLSPRPRFNAHSHTRNTAQPAARSARETLRSRWTFRASFAAQYPARVLGFVAWRGHTCQKQPSTKTATFAARKMKSGFPGSGDPRCQPVSLCVRNNLASRCSVLAFPELRTSAIIAERRSGVNMSAISRREVVRVLRR